MQDIITPTSYQTSVTEPQHPKHKTLIWALSAFILLVVVVVLVMQYNKRPALAPLSPLEQLELLEKSSQPVSLSPEQQFEQVRKLEAVGGSTQSSSVSDKLEMLKKLQ